MRPCLNSGVYYYYYYNILAIGIYIRTERDYPLLSRSQDDFLLINLHISIFKYPAFLKLKIVFFWTQNRIVLVVSFREILVFISISILYIMSISVTSIIIIYSYIK